MGKSGLVHQFDTNGVVVLPTSTVTVSIRVVSKSTDNISRYMDSSPSELPNPY